MLSRAFHRQCLLCCQSLAKQCTAVSQGQNSALQRHLSPVSTTTEQSLEQDSIVPETPKRTLVVCLENSDIIPESLIALSQNIIDATISSRSKTRGQAFLVFGSEETAKEEYKTFKTFGLNVNFLDEMNKSLWLQLYDRNSKNFIRKLSTNTKTVDLKEEGNESFAYVQFSSEEEALSVYKSLNFTDKREGVSWAGRRECVITKVDSSRTLWVGHFAPDVTDEQIKNMSCDPANVIIKLAENGFRYALMEFESESLAEKNYHFIRSKQIKAEMINTRVKSTAERFRAVTVFLKEGMTVQEFAKLDLTELSEDAMEGHYVQTESGVSKAHLMFESQGMAEKNSELLQARGYDVTRITDALNTCTNGTEEESSVERQRRIEHPQSTHRKLEKDETDRSGGRNVKEAHKDSSKTDSSDKVPKINRYSSIEIKERTLHLKISDDATAEEDIFELSSDIETVTMKQSARRSRYAYISFKSVELAEKNKMLFLEKGLDVKSMSSFSSVTGEVISRTLYIPLGEKRCSAEDIMDLCSDIQSARIIIKGRMSFAFAEFNTQEAAEKQLQLFRREGLKVSFRNGTVL